MADDTIHYSADHVLEYPYVRSVGPVIGAFIVVAMQQYLGQYLGEWVTVIQGSIFVVCVLLFRRGIVGEIATFFKLSL